MKGKRLVWVGASLLFAGCAGNVPVVSPATFTPLILARTAGVSVLQDEIFSCQSAEAPLVIREMLPGEAGPEAALILRWGEPDGLAEFVYVVGEDALVVIVHPDNDLDLKSPAIQAIYVGQVHDWDALGGEAGEIEVWSLMGHNEAAGLFETYVMGDLTILSNALLAVSPADILGAVTENPNAIGYLPASWATGAVRSIDLGIVQPILATSDKALDLPAQEWVACMQDKN